MDPWRPKHKRLYDALTAAVQLAGLAAFMTVFMAIVILTL